MTTAEADQLAARARDAGHVAKEVSQYKYLPGKNQAAFNLGVHQAREIIRAGVSTDDVAKQVPMLRLQMEGMIATLEAFVKGTMPMDDWS